MYAFPNVETLAAGDAAGSPVLLWASLTDGREVLIARDVWHVPRSGLPVRLGPNVDGCDVAAVVPGADLLLCACGGGTRAGAVSLHALPPAGVAPLATITLPGMEPGDRIEAISVAALPAAGDGGVLVLVVTRSAMHLLRAARREGRMSFSAARPPVDLRAGTLGLMLNPAPGVGAPPRSSGRATNTVLWVDRAGAPHAVIGRHGRVIVVPLGESGPAAAATDDPPLRVVKAHDDSDGRDPVTTGIALWLSGGAGPMVVSTGSDVHLSACALAGPAVIDAAYAFSRRASVLKARRSVVPRVVAVHEGSGVAFTLARSESRGQFHNLAVGALRNTVLSQTPEFAVGVPDAMVAAGFSRSGMLAFACAGTGAGGPPGGPPGARGAVLCIVRSAAPPPPPAHGAAPALAAAVLEEIEVV